MLIRRKITWGPGALLCRASRPLAKRRITDDPIDMHAV